MSSYIPGNIAISGYSLPQLDVIELRVISNLMQREAGNQNQDELSRLRNDQAFELGLSPPTVPGQ